MAVTIDATEAPDISGEAGQMRVHGRAYRQDSHDAMAGDVVRALIELLTNADDAYARAGSDGPIWVTVERTGSAKHVLIRVGDRGVGLRREEMLRTLLAAGARSSGHEQGVKARGLLGRGAKDTAIFGHTTYESIKGGILSSVTLLPGLEYRDLAPERPATADEPAATGDPRRRQRNGGDPSRRAQPLHGAPP